MRVPPEEITLPTTFRGLPSMDLYRYPPRPAETEGHMIFNLSPWTILAIFSVFYLFSSLYIICYCPYQPFPPPSRGF